MTGIFLALRLVSFHLLSSRPAFPYSERLTPCGLHLPEVLGTGFRWGLANGRHPEEVRGWEERSARIFLTYSIRILCFGAVSGFFFFLKACMIQASTRQSLLGSFSFHWDTVTLFLLLLPRHGAVMTPHTAHLWVPHCPCVFPYPCPRFCTSLSLMGVNSVSSCDHADTIVLQF